MAKAKYERFFKTYERKEFPYSFTRLDEMAIGRVWQHAQKGFILMSAFRGSDLEINLAKHKKLKNELRGLDLGFAEIDGTYVYDDGTRESELSVFIPFRPEIYDFEEFVKIGKYLGKKNQQESVLVKYPDSLGGKAVLVYPSGKEEVIGTNVGFDKVSSAYSKLRKGKHKGRSFILEGLRVPTNHIDAMSMKNERSMF